MRPFIRALYHLFIDHIEGGNQGALSRVVPGYWEKSNLEWRRTRIWRRFSRRRFDI